MKKNKQMFIRTLVVEMIILFVTIFLYKKGFINDFITFIIIIANAIISQIILSKFQGQESEKKSGSKVWGILTIGIGILIIIRVLYSKGSIDNNVALILTIINMLMINVCIFKVETK